MRTCCYYRSHPESAHHTSKDTNSRAELPRQANSVRERYISWNLALLQIAFPCVPLPLRRMQRSFRCRQKFGIPEKLIWWCRRYKCYRFYAKLSVCWRLPLVQGSSGFFLRISVVKWYVSVSGIVVAKMAASLPWVLTAPLAGRQSSCLLKSAWKHALFTII